MSFSLSQLLLSAAISTIIVGMLVAWLGRRTGLAAGAARRDSEVALLQARVAEQQSDLEDSEHRLNKSTADLEEMGSTCRAAQTELARYQERSEAIPELQQDLESALADRSRIANELAEARANISVLDAELTNERKQLGEKLALLTEAKEELSNQFKAIASDTLSRNSKELTDSSVKAISALVDPLKDRIATFDRQVVEARADDARNRQKMMGVLKQLAISQSQISEEANNLTKALKSDTKAQGTWGELIVEKILEKSGLRKGKEFDVQPSGHNEEGKRIRPDILVYLPENRVVVVDSKVSLTAFERVISADCSDAAAEALAAHVTSMKAHINGLSTKDYQHIIGQNSLDFVLMFVPNESALTMALNECPELFDIALEKNIGLVSPNLLMATLRTIENIWRSERQSENAERIASEAGAMLDKFVNFVKDLEQVGGRLDQATAAYDGAHRKLVSGRGSLVSRANKLQSLGAKSTKKLPVPIAEAANEFDSTKDVDCTTVEHECGMIASTHETDEVCEDYAANSHCSE